MDWSLGALRLIEFVEDTALRAKRRSHCCREGLVIVYAWRLFMAGQKGGPQCSPHPQDYGVKQERQWPREAFCWVGAWSPDSRTHETPLQSTESWKGIWCHDYWRWHGPVHYSTYGWVPALHLSPHRSPSHSGWPGPLCKRRGWV